MSKGLEKLKTIRHIHDMECGEDESINKDFDVIEEELKRLEELEKAFDALSKDDEKAKKLLSKEIEKNRALEIIKKTLPAFVYAITNSKDYQDYSSHYISPIITQEEYDILKEVLL